MKKIIKTAVTVELTPSEIIIVNAYRDEHQCSRMEAIRALIRGAKEEQRIARDIKFISSRIDGMSARLDGMMEVMQNIVTAVKDIRLGIAFCKIAIEELNRDDAAAMERVRNRYEAFKR